MPLIRLYDFYFLIMRENIDMAKIEYRPESVEFYSGDNFIEVAKLQLIVLQMLRSL